jgi:hypothetical protein
VLPVLLTGSPRSGLENLMKRSSFIPAATVALLSSSSSLQPTFAQDNDASVQLGPRPFFLVEDMDDGALKEG